MTIDDLNFSYMLEHCNSEFVATFWVCSVIIGAFFLIYAFVRLILYVVHCFKSYYSNKKEVNSEVKENEKA